MVQCEGRDVAIWPGRGGRSGWKEHVGVVATSERPRDRCLRAVALDDVEDMKSDDRGEVERAGTYTANMSHTVQSREEWDLAYLGQLDT